MKFDFIQTIKDRIQGKAEKGQRRSSQWRKVRDDYLASNPKCAVCESTSSCQVHHIVPFNIAPDLELKERNLITLCENKKYGINCHLLVGHLGNYRRVNSSVVIDAMTWNMKILGTRR